MAASDCTVEVAHERIIELINVLHEVCAADPRLARIVPILDSVIHAYEMDITGALLQYYEDSSRAATYWGLVISNDIVGRLAWCVNFLSEVNIVDAGAGSGASTIATPRQARGRGAAAAAARRVVSAGALSALSARASAIKITIAPVADAANECEECGGARVNMRKLSDRICVACGVYTPDTGILTDDIPEGYNMKQKRQKNGGHDTSRHWRLWIQRIQAREKWETPPAVAAAVRNGFLRRGIREADRMHCCLIRIFLKEADMTIHNDHVPSIRKEVCGIVPPQLTSDELLRGELIFHKACEAFAENKPKGVSNNPYYPYIARKILECILADGDRKNRIMDCIHLQGQDTLVKNDRMWEPTCVAIGDPELQYRPTNRAEYQIA